MRKQHGATGHPEGNPQVDALAKLGYESRDVALPTLTRWLVYLFVFIAGSIGVTFGVYRFLVPAGAEENRSQPLTTVRRTPPARAPIVQAHPRRDMIVFRREEAEALNGYGWVNQNKGVVKIPVDRAIDLIAERGLPAPRGVGSVGGVLGAAPAGLGQPRTPTQPPLPTTPVNRNQSQIR